jgi:hypothetical protein
MLATVGWWGECGKVCNTEKQATVFHGKRETARQSGHIIAWQPIPRLEEEPKPVDSKMAAKQKTNLPNISGAANSGQTSKQL